MTKEEFIENIKYYLLTKCVGTISEATGKESPPSIWKKDINKGFHSNVEGHFNFRAAEIEILLRQAIKELIDSENMRDDNPHFFYKYV